jgi:E3 ubiquitin-protein ligase HUWE1
MFVTGTSSVPLDGFAHLNGMRGGTQKFSIHRAARSETTLPSSHTCFNQLDLPQYPTEEILQKKLLLACTECYEGFGFV